MYRRNLPGVRQDSLDRQGRAGGEQRLSRVATTAIHEQPFDRLADGHIRWDQNDADERVATNAAKWRVIVVTYRDTSTLTSSAAPGMNLWAGKSASD